MKSSIAIISIVIITLLTGCNSKTQEDNDRKLVQQQQGQYAKSQPVPVYDWSMERHLVIQLYNMRNIEAVTHSVWRSNWGTVEGDCSSIGFGIPFDTSLTNPLQLSTIRGFDSNAAGVIEQAEPNGIFASKNTNATWVLCAGTGGTIDPVYVETKVTTYPYPVSVDYDTNRVKKAGNSSVTLTIKQ